jgi:hypothetical protein
MSESADVQIDDSTADSVRKRAGVISGANPAPTSVATRDRSFPRSLVSPAALALAVTVLGLVLRVEHALTFDGPLRGSDYFAYISGLHWVEDHLRPFWHDPSAHVQVRYHPPLWFWLAAFFHRVTGSERAIATLGILGFLVRQAVLAKLMHEVAPWKKWSSLAALSIHALVPLAVLMDAKVNPEGLHATLFFVGAYWLWRIERQAGETAGLRIGTAMGFGVLAGLSLLVKATSVVLLPAAVIVIGARLAMFLRAEPSRAALRTAWQRLGRPMTIAAGVWLLVVAGWIGPNLWKFHHPFPHSWDLDPREEMATLPPLLYRRPIGWALPFGFGDYLRFPILGGPETPNPNFWSYTVVGTWTDLYNRGFCRLKGGPLTDKVWGGERGTLAAGPEWAVTRRCVRNFSRLAWTGLVLAVAAVAAVVHLGRRALKSGFREGSLALPVSISLVVAFVCLFALKYPFDGDAVLNPKYLLCIVAPMSACLGLGLQRFRQGTWAWKAAHGVVLTATALVGVLLVYQRFG